MIYSNVVDISHPDARLDIVVRELYLQITGDGHQYDTIIAWSSTPVRFRTIVSMTWFDKNDPRIKAYTDAGAYIVTEEFIKAIR